MQRNIKAVASPVFHVKRIHGVSTQLAYDCKPAANYNKRQSINEIFQPEIDRAAKARRAEMHVVRTPSAAERDVAAALLAQMRAQAEA